MKKAIICIVFTTILYSEFTYGKQDYCFRHINTESGLSQNTVLCILQDKTGFMWFGTKDGLNRFDGNSMKIFKRNENNTTSIGNNTIWTLLEMSDGKIWAGTDKGIYIYNPDYESFTFFGVKNENNEYLLSDILDIKKDKSGKIWIICGGNIYRYIPDTQTLETIKFKTPNHLNDASNIPRAWSINVDNDNIVWISVFHGGLVKFNSVNDEYTYYIKGDKGRDLASSLISNTININNKYLLIGSFYNGLCIMDKNSGEFFNYSMENDIGEGIFVRTITHFSDGNFWIGTESGLYINNSFTDKTLHLQHDANDRYSLSDNAVYSMYEDREGGIWIGTYFGGINYYPIPYNDFKKYYPIKGKNSISGERVSGICEDEEGFIWIGTEDAGLNRYNPVSQLFEHIQINENNGLNYHNIHDIITDGDLLWIATFSHGINVLNRKTGKWKYYLKDDKPGSLNNNDIFALFKDTSGNIWIGTSSGAFIYDAETDSFISIDFLKPNFVSDIIEDSSGHIWFATYNNGVFRYNLVTKEIVNFEHDPNDIYSICYHKIISIFIDNRERIWFASESGGICMYDEPNKKFIRYGEKDGFSNNVIYKILEDDFDNLWLSSNMGLIRFNPDSKKVRIFTKIHGLPGNQFNYKSGYKDKTGKMYFGSLNGLITFQPADFNINNTIPPVVITDFKLLNSEIFHKKNQLNSHVKLKYKQSSFSFDFAALSFVAPEMNLYAYKMEGLEDNWNYLQKPQRIIYSNLPHGKYIFRVKASNNDGLWNNVGDSVSIEIMPPFWKTAWAYIIYVLIFLVFAFIALQYYNQIINAKNKRNQILFEKEKEKEMYDAKIEFFTNIAHEIRTPLTLIKGPLEYILKNELEIDELNSNLLVMEKNTNRLLALINQLLDFRKTESRGFKLSFVKTNINELVSETFIRFKPFAQQRSLEFTCDIPEISIFADVDREALVKILSNLFNNALLYASSLTEVKLNDENIQFKIIVKSNGNKIPSELKERIFEPFFRIENEVNTVKKGTGIGLALVKYLVELHNGKVYLADSENDINSFIILFPKSQKDVINIDNINSSISETLSSKEILEHDYNQKQNSLLLVEDNEELLGYISEKLNVNYNVFEAKNGIEALDILTKESIDVVISDIMMPQMDGIELCSTIKNNMEYSHIPIILLTAKTNIQSKISGLDSGADAYIEKPFSFDYLQAQIKNLLDNRKKILQVFANSPFVHTGSIALTKSDEKFLNKITEIIYKNISNSEFNVDLLASEMYMSRSSLLRKIKGISKFTPNDFVRLIRLKRAAEILKEGDYKVNEVCFLVGFSSTSYFSKAFCKQFGVLPKDFIKNIRREEKSSSQRIPNNLQF